MLSIKRLSIAEQTAGHLRRGLRAGRWAAGLPGVLRLAAEFQVSKGAVRTALQMLEKEGMLGRGDVGKGRTLADIGATDSARRVLRVGIFLHERMEDENPWMQSLLFQLHNELETAGHVSFFSTQCQAGLHHDPARIAHYVAGVRADAWVVVAARTEVLEWFAAQPCPAISIGNMGAKLVLAATGTDSGPSAHVAVRALLALGHRRIVSICPARGRHPTLGPTGRALASELQQRGLPWSHAYHVPEWEETPAGFRELLTGLFSATPPTALLIDETPRVVATFAFLAERGLRVPQQVSLVAMYWDSALAWCHPPLAHIPADATALLDRIVRWCGAVQDGIPDHEKIAFPMEFVPGGSIAPVWQG